MQFLERSGCMPLILVAAEIFVNASEHPDERLNLPEGVTGSLFAAVGTALPGTLVPPMLSLRLMARGRLMPLQHDLLR